MLTIKCFEIVFVRENEYCMTTVFNNYHQIESLKWSGSGLQSRSSKINSMRSIAAQREMKTSRDVQGAYFVKKHHFVV